MEKRPLFFRKCATFIQRGCRCSVQQKLVLVGFSYQGKLYSPPLVSIFIGEAVFSAICGILLLGEAVLVGLFQWVLFVFSYLGKQFLRRTFFLFIYGMQHSFSGSLRLGSQICFVPQAPLFPAGERFCRESNLN